MARFWLQTNCDCATAAKISWNPHETQIFLKCLHFAWHYVKPPYSEIWFLDLVMLVLPRLWEVFLPPFCLLLRWLGEDNMVEKDRDCELLKMCRLCSWEVKDLQTRFQCSNVRKALKKGKEDDENDSVNLKVSLWDSQKQAITLDFRWGFCQNIITWKHFSPANFCRFSWLL